MLCNLKLIRVNAIWGGVLALALCIPSFARADETVGGDDPDHEATSPDGAQQVRERLAAKFDVQEARISSLRDEGLGYGEIDHALTLADRLPGGITDENVDHVLDMRQDQHMGWGEIAHDMDTTLGEAKHSPPPATTPTDGGVIEPTSVSRPGKSAASAQSGASGHGHAHGPGGLSGGSGPGGRAGGTVAAHGHGRGMASSSSHGKANGKAGGHK